MKLEHLLLASFASRMIGQRDEEGLRYLSDSPFGGVAARLLLAYWDGPIPSVSELGIDEVW